MVPGQNDGQTGAEFPSEVLMGLTHLLPLSLSKNRIYPAVHVQEFSRVRILEVALVGCRVYKSSALLDNSETSFKSIVALPTHQQYVKVSLALHLHQHLILLEFYTNSEQMKSLLCFKFAFSEILSLVICLCPPCPF